MYVGVDTFACVDVTLEGREICVFLGPAVNRDEIYNK